MAVCYNNCHLETETPSGYPSTQPPLSAFTMLRSVRLLSILGLFPPTSSITPYLRVSSAKSSGQSPFRRAGISGQ